MARNNFIKIIIKELLFCFFIFCIYTLFLSFIINNLLLKIVSIIGVLLSKIFYDNYLDIYYFNKYKKRDNYDNT